jgi:hypothetical protein
MDILSPWLKDEIRNRLQHLVQERPVVSSRSRFMGRVIAHQVVIGVRKQWYSLPWRGVFRGAMLEHAHGSAVTGKFDSNWSLYFLGYPVLLGVSLNLAVSLYLANGSARVGWFILLMGAAAFLCIVLRQIEICDERVISAATVAAIEGRQVHMLPVE